MLVYQRVISSCGISDQKCFQTRMPKDWISSNPWKYLTFGETWGNTRLPLLELLVKVFTSHWYPLKFQVTSHSATISLGHWSPDLIRWCPLAAAWDTSPLHGCSVICLGKGHGGPQNLANVTVGNQSNQLPIQQRPLFWHNHRRKSSHLPHHLAAGGPGGDLEGAQSALEQIDAMPSLATAAGGATGNPCCRASSAIRCYDWFKLAIIYTIIIAYQFLIVWFNLEPCLLFPTWSAIDLPFLYFVVA